MSKFGLKKLETSFYGTVQSILRYIEEAWLSSVTDILIANAVLNLRCAVNKFFSTAKGSWDTASCMITSTLVWCILLKTFDETEFNTEVLNVNLFQLMLLKIICHHHQEFSEWMSAINRNAAVEFDKHAQRPGLQSAQLSMKYCCYFN